MYDDHDYCGRCQGHSRACWCWSKANDLNDADPDDVCPGGSGHD
jgi:hypothetical protein